MTMQAIPAPDVTEIRAVQVVARDLQRIPTWYGAHVAVGSGAAGLEARECLGPLGGWPRLEWPRAADPRAGREPGAPTGQLPAAALSGDRPDAVGVSAVWGAVRLGRPDRAGDHRGARTARPAAASVNAPPPGPHPRPRVHSVNINTRGQFNHY